jgi:DNA-binding MarR family transcriptional regulator
VEDAAVLAIQAWTRLDQAIGGFNRALHDRFGVTGAQLAILRLITEWAAPSSGKYVGVVPLAVLRQRLVMHPATLGQLIDRLAERGLVTLRPDPADRRRRMVSLTAAGSRLIEQAPLAGPVRLRHIPAGPDRLRRLAEAFHDAIVLFGLEEYVDDRSGDPAEHRPQARR